ncbi:hypothetical protein Thimo_3583 [Thioflavicoccus mobilis 8321]|uniref:Uncharacterized protein n=1 Tax=Thioflavicoccus mobilis 8321 TaxID=765912 RepID=L0H3S2_9GAMM|nr:hypothetical protein [Thioflavicoccus mobilis]AGA92239.1 hypothetical protein Thimo_3583 [Thioflavicoccus mobilis 8321]
MNPFVEQHQDDNAAFQKTLRKLIDSLFVAFGEALSYSFCVMPRQRIAELKK